MRNSSSNSHDKFHPHGHDVLIAGIGHTDREDREDMFIPTGRATEKGVKVLNDIFRRAFIAKATDVHIKFSKQNNRVRFRIADELKTICYIDPADTFVIDDKIRSRAHLSTTDRRSPQDNRMSLVSNGTNYDIRVSVSPGVNDSQLIVCRILNQNNSNIRLADIEMPHAARDTFLRLLAEPNGLFLVTGPTGSGKTTTLYAMLNELNIESKNIMSIEDPVEYQIDEFQQLNVDERSGLSFARGLKALLRQDPDVILIGEIRDIETANIAIQAALTGHLVLSSLHTNSAPGAITRMIDLGVDPMTLSAALRGVVAQRLVKTLDHHALVERREANANELRWLKNNNILRINPTYPKFINQQVDTTFNGVTPVMEIVLADHRVKRVIQQGEAAIYEAASRQPQFETLAQASERLAFVGRTTLDEARRLTSAQEAPVITNKRLGQVLVESSKISPENLEEFLTLQAKERASGNAQGLGKFLVNAGLCTAQDITDAVGYTAEAQDIIQKLCLTDERRTELVALVRKWSAGTESLFSLAIASKLVTMDDLINETIV